MDLGCKNADGKSSLLVRAKIHSEIEQSWWMYPIARFFGHALYEYRYNIDFSDHTSAVNQERNLILYQSYCDLLGSLVAKSVQDRGHKTKPQDVIMGIIGFAYIHSEDERESILNLLRAVHGVYHFGCVIMRYCNFFKCLCLEDMRICVTSTDLKLHNFWKQIMDILSECIYEKEHRKYYEELQTVFDLRDQFHLPSILISIPFICEIGIKLNSGLNYDDLMKDLQSQFTAAISHKEATKYVKETEEKCQVLANKAKEKMSKDNKKDLGDKETLSKDQPVEDVKMEDESEFVLPSEGIQHEEISNTETISSNLLSPYAAIQSVIEKFRSANEPVPTNLLTNLSHLKIKDPYTEYARAKSTKGHSPPAGLQSKSTTKGWSPPSNLQSKSIKGLSPPSSSLSSIAVIPHAASPGPSTPLHKPKEGLFSPKLAFSSGLFSPDVAERNKIIVDLPNSDSSRENYILNEYDCRMKKHITFQAAAFEVLNARESLHEVSNLIHQQRRFEERWPSRYSETSPSGEFYDENVFDFNIEVREVDMTELVKESQEVIKVLQQLLNNVDPVKQKSKNSNMHVNCTVACENIQQWT